MKKLYQGAFDLQSFGLGFDTRQQDISHTTRTQAVFVNYDPTTNEWISSILVQKHRVLKIIKEMKTQLERFRKLVI